MLENVMPKTADRISACGYRRFGDDVKLFQKQADGSAFVGGVQHCGSVWLCPNCTLRINELRKRELDALLVGARAARKSVHLMTLTASHTRKTDLKAFLTAMKAAMDHLRTGRAWRGLKVHGTVTATETTYGQNGHHPHFHILILMDQAPNQAAALLQALRQEWMRSLAYVGLTGNQNAFQVQDGSAAGQYVAKWGAAEELTMKAEKKGRKASRSPWQLLDDARDGDLEAGKAWVEYAQVFKGRRQLVWAKGLKALYRIEETTDAEAAEAEAAQGEVIVLRTWDARTAWRDARLRICAILDAAEAGTDLLVAEFGPTDAQRWRDGEALRRIETGMTLTE